MKMEDIGFYTLTDERVKNVSPTSQMMRCELILTDVCNFKCPYCRGQEDRIKGTMQLADAKHILDLWAKDNLKNVRFSGGEPTMYKHIVELVAYARDIGIERIAISTNGSAKRELYDRLLDAGANDISISLDACCSSDGDMMAGGIKGSWVKVIENTKYLATKTYVTVGVVVTEDNVEELPETIAFAASLGVADIRIISAAQFNQLLTVAERVPEDIYEKYPILRYRMENLGKSRNVRGIQYHNSHRCALVLDDMAIAGNYHYPCIIYMREQGDPIGVVSNDMRAERLAWFKTHDTHADSICRNNCLDVCIDHNDRYDQFTKD